MNELLKKDIISVDIVGKISRSDNKICRQRNKNLASKISKDNIDKLFKIIKICDNDLDSNFTIL